MRTEYSPQECASENKATTFSEKRKPCHARPARLRRPCVPSPLPMRTATLRSPQAVEAHAVRHADVEAGPFASAGSHASAIAHADAEAGRSPATLRSPQAVEAGGARIRRLARLRQCPCGRSRLARAPSP